MTTDQVLTVIGFIGIGGLLKSLIDYAVELFKTKADSKHTLKETRYKAIILLCYTYAHYDNDGRNLIDHRPKLTTLEKLYDELKVEWSNMALYGSDSVILKMKDFLEKKNEASYTDLIIVMRKDLYGIKTKLKSEDFILKNQ
jgi:hypothetical protein